MLILLAMIFIVFPTKTFEQLLLIGWRSGLGRGMESEGSMD